MTIHTARARSRFGLRLIKRKSSRKNGRQKWKMAMQNAMYPQPPLKRGLEVYPTDILALIGLGGIWIAFFVRHLKARPLLPANDPRDTYSHAHGH